MYTIPNNILFGRSEAMREVRKTIEKVYNAPVPVLLEGEMGTGKEAIGHAIHRSSPWRSGPFTKIDTRGTYQAPSSGSNAESLARLLGLSDALWGGSGTLFIEEIGDLAPFLQAKLLDFFQECHAQQSENGTIAPTLLRILCSSRRDLENDVAVGRLRADLFYRINVVVIHLPRLRDRREDIPELAAFFHRFICIETGRDCPKIPDGLLRAFCEYQWPGNIRELENCVNTYVRSNGNVAITEACLRQVRSDGRPLAPKAVLPLRAYARQITAKAEREMILKVLAETRWNRKDAAKALQISYHTLLQKLKQTGISKSETAASGEENLVPKGHTT